MIIKMSKEELSAICLLIDKYGIDDRADVEIIDKLTDQYTDREDKEYKLTLGQVRKLDMFEELVINALNTYISKNIDYGDSFSKSYKEFGVVASVVRISDKVERLKSLVDKEPEVIGESFKDTLMDLANYAFMTVLEIDSKDGVVFYSEGEAYFSTPYTEGDKLNI